MSELRTRIAKLKTRNSPLSVVSGGRGGVSSLKFRVFNFEFRVAKLLVAVVVASVGFLAASPMLAQGCPLCYNTAAAASGKGIAALRHGILILMFPPMVIFGVVTFFAVRGRNHFNDDAEQCDPNERAA